MKEQLKGAGVEKAKEDPLVKECMEFVNHARRILNDLQAELSSINKTQVKVTQALAAHKKEQEKVVEILNTIEETHRNVLVAIRQNEYLQAYYPAQQGYPAMKVVGSHPVQLKRQVKVKDEVLPS